MPDRLGIDLAIVETMIVNAAAIVDAARHKYILLQTSDAQRDIAEAEMLLTDLRLSHTEIANLLIAFNERCKPQRARR